MANSKSNINFTHVTNERNRMANLFQHAPGFVCVLRGENHIFEIANHAYLELVGKQEIIGKSVAEALPEVIEQGFLKILDDVYCTGKPFVGRAVPIVLELTKEKTTETRYIDFVYQPILDDENVCTGIFVQGYDVTENNLLALKVAYQANHDPLTGLGNRRMLAEQVSLLCHTNTNSILYIDLDHFKIINDSCGHTAGDTVLVDIAQKINGLVDDSYSLIRIGGDELVLLMPNTSESQACQQAERIRNTIEQSTFVWLGQQYRITTSIGLAEFSGATHLSFEDALRRADAACFLAKDKGRNRVQVSRVDDQEVRQQLSDMAWTTRLNDAIRDDRIVLYGQKIFEVSHPNSSERIEILARLMNDQGEIVSPGLFIPAAERFGLIEQLDRHILSKVFEMMARRQEENKTHPKMFVNVSGITLSNSGFVEFLENLSASYPSISPSTICIEITERAAVTNLELTTAMMMQIKNLGFSFALDDFGSGVATFNYLEQLPVSYVKIAGEFVSTLKERLVSYAIVKSIQHIADVMNVETIAESIEDDSLLVTLQDLGIKYGQGYGLHRPESMKLL